MLYHPLWSLFFSSSIKPSLKPSSLSVPSVRNLTGIISLPKTSSQALWWRKLAVCKQEVKVQDRGWFASEQVTAPDLPPRDEVMKPMPSCSLFSQPFPGLPNKTTCLGESSKQEMQSAVAQNVLVCAETIHQFYSYTPKYLSRDTLTT